jgi:hypothetical protein
MHIQTKGNKSESAKTKSTNRNRACGRCGSTHEYGKCPAYGKKCKRCEKKGHFKKCCKTKTQHTLSDNTNEPDQHSIDQTHTLFTDSLDVYTLHNDWVLPMTVNKQIIPMKLDTGAQACTINEHDYRLLRPKPKLSTTTVQLRAYGNKKVDVLGKCILTVQYKDRKSTLQFYVVKGDSQALLSKDACLKLNLVKLVAQIDKQDVNNIQIAANSEKVHKNYREFIKDNHNVFEGLG